MTTWSYPGRFARIQGFGLVVLVLGLVAAPAPRAAQGPATAVAAQTASLPDRLGNAEFWKLVSDISEPGGYFRITDNYTSNEPEIGQLFTMLRQTNTSGGVYLGVGPEQNLTYIAAIRPRMAFIVDIRRQAVMQHLMFKAVFELSNDRADFLSLLFSRARPARLDPVTPIAQIWDAYLPLTATPELTAKNFARVSEHLTRTHGFTFTPEESSQLEDVFTAFAAFGPRISTRGGGPGGGGGGRNVTFVDLTGYSYDAAGTAHSFLTTDDNFRFVKSLHEKNLIVPVSGDFGGPKTIRAIGAYLQQHRGTVSAFYVSNVEQYLFQDGKAQAFYDNVATLPMNDSTVFIRPYSLRRSGPRDALCPMAPFLTAVKAGQVTVNEDALSCGR